MTFCQKSFNMLDEIDASMNPMKATALLSSDLVIKTWFIKTRLLKLGCKTWVVKNLGRKIGCLLKAAY